MKRLKCSLAAKITAWIMSFVSLVVCVACVVGAVVMLDGGFYTRTETDLQMHSNRALAQDIYSRLAVSYEKYRHEPSDLSFEEFVVSIADEKNWRYTLNDQNQKLISGNYKQEKATEYSFEGFYYYDEVWDSNEQPQGEPYYVSIYVLDEKKETDQFSICEKLLHMAYSMRFGVYAILFVSAIVFFVLVSFLFASAGHRKADEPITRGICEHIPFDLFTLFFIPVAYLNDVILIFCGEITQLLLLFVVPVLAFLDYALVSLWLKSLSVRIKTRTLLKEMLIYRVLYAVFNPIFDGFKMEKGLIRTLIISLIPCLILLYLLLAIVSQYLLETLIFIWAVCTAVFVSVSLIHAAKLKKLCAATERIALGDFSYIVDTKLLYGEMNELGKNINRINQGLQIAVTDKMKSERFKTELITNVSHDLKTPLTSIINYVELLSKLELDDKAAQEYIEILSRQSARLKKLIDDLLEASKASTGNIKMEFSRCDIGVLLSQTVGEFSERLEKAELIPIVSLPQQPVFAMVDGRRLYRVFENLMSNICKYSQPNTRVYLDVTSKENSVIIRFRNISKDMLAVSGEELTERFVRGDSSRNTEGSGLGLSIAKSLTELQNGKISIRVDGDLFDVTITFAAAGEEKS